MQSRIELPAKYYLSHFREFLDVLVSQHERLLDESHQNFLNDFYALSEDAQCLLVRMINRKGHYFFKESLRYQEIFSYEDAFSELKEKSFIRDLNENDRENLIKFLPKEELLELAIEREIPLKRSWPRQRLEELLQNEIQLTSARLTSIIVQGRTQELSYLLFLFFGRIEENLSLYTLRDLGIKKVNRHKTSHKSRYKSKAEALSHYFYAALADGIISHEDYSSWPKALNQEAQDIREILLINISQQTEKSEDALHVLSLCEKHPGREKYIRLLYQMDKKEVCLQEIEKVLNNPCSDLEHLFAVDFLERKFHKKRTSILTDTLRSARKIGIDESYFRQPEAGVIDYLKGEGAESYHVENYVWNALFALLFWEEIFESDKMHFRNEFEIVPQELFDGSFYQIHENEIREKLKKPIFLPALIEKLELIKDRPNGIFRTSCDLPLFLERLVSHSHDFGLKEVLLTMCRDYHLRSTGFPDLMTMSKGKIKFFEVKAPGDVLKEKQLLQLQLLKKAGFEVEVIQAEYIFNPNQVYVVVDIETTGGMHPYHRITELGAVKVRNGEIIDQYQTLVNPGRPISREIQQLTGITNEMVKDAPKFSDVLESFDAFTKDAIFVAHNVAFDYGFIQSEFAKLDKVFTRPFICTKVSMKKYYPGLESYSLKNLSLHFGISLEGHHRALCDARAAAELLLLVNKKRAGS